MGLDTVQIGPFVVSKVVLDTLAPLLGVLIGGLLTYFSTRSLEARKWRQERQYKLQEQQREAIALAMEWIDPMKNALIQVQLLVSSFVYRDMSEQDFLKRWPDLLSSLATKDLPPRLRVLLPPNSYQRGVKIALGMDQLKGFTLMQRPKTGDDLIKAMRECSDELGTLQALMDGLERDLEQEYKKTFE